MYLGGCKPGWGFGVWCWWLGAGGLMLVARASAPKKQCNQTTKPTNPPTNHIKPPTDLSGDERSDDEESEPHAVLLHGRRVGDLLDGFAFCIIAAQARWLLSACCHTKIGYSANRVEQSRRLPNAKQPTKPPKDRSPLTSAPQEPPGFKPGTHRADEGERGAVRKDLGELGARLQHQDVTCLQPHVGDVAGDGLAGAVDGQEGGAVGVAEARLAGGLGGWSGVGGLGLGVGGGLEGGLEGWGLEGCFFERDSGGEGEGSVRRRASPFVLLV